MSKLISDVTFSQTCIYCQKEITPSQKRKTTVTLSEDKLALVDIRMIHQDPCQIFLEQLIQKQLLHQIEFPPWVSVTSFEQLEKSFPVVAELSKCYPTAGIKVSLYGYRLEFPIESKSQLIEKKLMPFNHFKAFFGAVFIHSLHLTGLRVHDYLPALVKKCAALSHKLSVSCFAWIHQVSGSNDRFRVVMLMMPEEAQLVPLYNSGIFKTWLDTKDHSIPAVSKIVEVAKRNLTDIQNCFSETAQIVGLELERTVEGQALAQTTEVKNRNGLRTDYNVQVSSSEKEVYILPHPDMYTDEKNTPLLLCSFPIAEDLLVPVVYDTSIRDLEKEYNNKTMKKIQLTNYNCLLARYPRAINRPS